MTREEASTLFRENDKDKDGFISMEEYFGKERRIREREREREIRKRPHICNAADSFLALPLPFSFLPSFPPLSPLSPLSSAHASGTITTFDGDGDGTRNDEMFSTAPKEKRVFSEGVSPDSVEDIFQLLISRVKRMLERTAVVLTAFNALRRGREGRRGLLIFRGITSWASSPPPPPPPLHARLPRCMKE